MSRNEQIEEILEARYAWESATREAKAECESAFWQLVDRAIAGKKTSRHELMHSLHDRYLAFKKEQIKKDRVRLAQLMQSRKPLP